MFHLYGRGNFGHGFLSIFYLLFAMIKGAGVRLPARPLGVWVAGFLGLGRYPFLILIVENAPDGFLRFFDCFAPSINSISLVFLVFLHPALWRVPYQWGRRSTERRLRLFPFCGMLAAGGEGHEQLYYRRGHQKSAGKAGPYPDTTGECHRRQRQGGFQMGNGSFPKLKKLPKTHAYITSNIKIKDLLEVLLWLRT